MKLKKSLLCFWFRVLFADNLSSNSVLCRIRENGDDLPPASIGNLERKNCNIYEQKLWKTKSSLLKLIFSRGYFKFQIQFPIVEKKEKQASCRWIRVVYEDEQSTSVEIRIAVKIGKEPDQLLSSCFSLLNFKFQ